MRLSAWRSKRATAARKRNAKPLDQAAIRAQAIESLIASRGLTREQAEREYDGRNSRSAN